MGPLFGSRRTRRTVGRCERAVDALELPEGVRDLRALCDLVGSRLNRQIDLQYMHTPVRAYCGLTLVEEQLDTIIVEADTSWRQQMIIGGHELGHRILAHQPLDGHDIELNLTGKKVYTRSVFARREELEAEVVAGLLIGRAMMQTPGRPGAERGDVDPLLDAGLDPAGVRGVDDGAGRG